MFAPTLLRLFLLACLALLAPGASQAAAPTRPLVVAVEANSWPIAFSTAQGAAAGLLVDYWREVTQGTELAQAELRPMVWREAIAAFRRGEVDVIAGAARTVEREAYARFTAPFYSTPNVLVSRRDGRAIVNLRDAEGRRLAIMGDHFMVPALRQRHPQVALTEVKSSIDAMHAVATGMVDVALVHSEVAVQAITHVHGKRLVITGVPHGATADLAMMVQPTLEPVRRLLHERLLGLSAAQQDTIRARWLTASPSPGFSASEALQRMLPLLALLLTAAALSGYWIWRLQREVQLRRRAEAELRGAHDEAQSRAQARHRFISFLAHETRSLVGAVQGGLQLLAPSVDARSRGLVEAIRCSASSLHALLTVSLDSGQIDRGTLQLQPQALDLDRVVADVAQELSPLAEIKGLRLLASPGTPRTQAWADDVRVRQLLRNLVANAIKFSAAGQVRLAPRLHDEHRVAIDVVDSGRGIVAQDLARLFAADTRVGDQTGLIGTGLGLAMSRDIARSMGGDIVCASEPGRGSTFTLLLPCPATRATPDGSDPQRCTEPGKAPEPVSLLV